MALISVQTGIIQSVRFSPLATGDNEDIKQRRGRGRKGLWDFFLKKGEKCEFEYAA